MLKLMEGRVRNLATSQEIAYGLSHPFIPLPEEPMSKATDSVPTLVVRNSTAEDFTEIMALYARVYPQFPNYTYEMLLGQMNNFPRGQFVAIYEGVLVGFCCTFRIRGDVALKPHNWDEI